MTKPAGRAYPGGKGGVGVYQTIINCMPPHETYIEAFLGGGAVLLNKLPARRNFGIDLDEEVVRRWADVDIPRLEILHGDARDILRDWSWQVDDYRRTLVYCDPPYLRETRSSKRLMYRRDFPYVEDHHSLLQTLTSLPCMVMVSGYTSPLYDSMIGHWRRVEFQTRNRAGAATVEIVWMNFPAPLELHDYRHLGRGFRERERIKRKRDRWKAKLLKMPDLERHAVLSAINELSDPG
jgi:DNA adenine methylase